MPAETHSHRDAITAEQVLELLWVLVTDPEDPDAAAGPFPDRRLEALGIADDLALLELWEQTTEEYGERTLGELDLDAARDAADLGELAEVFARACVADPDADPDDGAGPS
jgi:hypothetical protein